jgi:hypothetical protein
VPQIIEILIIAPVLFGVWSFAVGLRPSRHDFPTRLLAIVGLYSVPVGLATCALVRDEWTHRLKDWFDPEGFLLTFVLAIVSFGGVIALLPAWGYALGRTVNWARSGQGSRSASSCVGDFSKKSAGAGMMEAPPGTTW